MEQVLLIFVIVRSLETLYFCIWGVRNTRKVGFLHFEHKMIIWIYCVTHFRVTSALRLCRILGKRPLTTSGTTPIHFLTWFIMSKSQSSPSHCTSIRSRYDSLHYKYMFFITYITEFEFSLNWILTVLSRKLKLFLALM